METLERRLRVVARLRHGYVDHLWDGGHVNYVLHLEYCMFLKQHYPEAYRALHQPL